MKLSLALAATLATLLALGVAVVQSPDESEAATAVDPFQVQVGEEQKVLGPSGIVDMTYHTTRNSAGKLIGFTANNDSYAFDVTSSGALTNQRRVLRKGDTGRFDHCGAWLLGSVHQVTSTHWVGWYHAESPNPSDDGRCVFKDGRTRWSMAFTQSFDGGRTWRKSNYPNNQVLTQDSGLLGDPFTEDAGNARIFAAEDGYFYAFFQAATRTNPLRLLNVARAPIQSRGVPGSWQKYYCSDPTDESTCGFTEPGLGGKSTHLKGIPAAARYVSYNSYLGRFVAVHASGLAGFRLWVSDADNFLRWSPHSIIYPRVSTTTDPRVDVWGDRDGRDRQVYAYASLIGANGDSQYTGQNLWLYYMKVFPGDGYESRYLMRRKVSLRSLAGQPPNRVRVTTYRRGDGLKRTSTERPGPSGRYATVAHLAYLLTDARSGYAPVFECSSTTRQDHWLKLSSCAKGSKPIRRVGWIARTRTPEADVPLYRCYDRALRNHFSSTSARCGGKKKVALIGYALRSLG